MNVSIKQQTGTRNRQVNGSQAISRGITLTVLVAACFTRTAAPEVLAAENTKHAVAKQHLDTIRTGMKCDGAIQMLRASHLHGYEASRLGGRAGRLVKASGDLNVNVSFRRPLTSDEVSRYEIAGVKFMTLDDGSVANFDRHYPAWVSPDALEFLSNDNMVVHVGVGSPLQVVETLDQSVPEITADVRHRLPTGPWFDGNQGQGITIANMDTGIDQFHPDFFYPRTGLNYEWIDRNGNGTFTPMTDCVDLNRNNNCDGNETLAAVVMSGSPLNYRADRDWLFNDANSNGLRDYGTANGFGENDDAYGELVFVVNDSNKNGLLDLGERITPLGESKVKALLTSDGAGSVRQYNRGVDLINAPVDPHGHGTSVSSILVAQDYGYNRLHVGVAPEAELLVVDRVGSNNQIYNLQWAKSQGADVILWEFGAWINQYLDGSSQLEQAIREDMTQNNCLHILPNGNLASSDRHAAIQIAGNGGQQTLSFSVPTGIAPATISLSALWQGQEDNLTFEMKAPGGVFQPLTVPSFPDLGNNYRIFPHALSVSPRQTARYDATIFRTSQTIPGGSQWQLRVTNQSGVAKTAHLYLADSATTWNGGVAWNGFATDAQTITFPATADLGLNVGSYSIHSLGEFSYFSGQGPRIDGNVTLLGITAPGHHDITCATSGLGVNWAPMTLGFGGTSAAGPHAAGAAALLMSAVPEATPTEVMNAIQDAARKDADTGPTYNQAWGDGKLRVNAAYELLASQNCDGITLGGFQPADGSVNLDSTSGISFSWNDDNRADRYDLLFGTSNPPTTLIPNLVVTSLAAGTLEPNQTYYWQVIGRNNCGGTTASTVMTFTTSGPTAPEIDVRHNGNSIANGASVLIEQDPGRELLTVTNDGQATLTISDVRLTPIGNSAPAFSIDVFPPSTIAPLSSASLRVVLDTNEPGEYEATLTIENNDANESPYTIYVSAQVDGNPQLQVSIPGTLNNTIPIDAFQDTDSTYSFEDTETTLASELVVTVHNFGDAPLIFNAAPELTGSPAFLLDGALPDALGPGQEHELPVIFAPETAGTHQASLRIDSNDPNRNPFIFHLTGFGIEVTPLLDCNGNGQDDLEDIALGLSNDCDENQVPDECQTDTDGDTVIDACDACPDEDDRVDTDNDLIPDCADNCPLTSNPLQQDSDFDGQGDACAEVITDCNGNGTEDADDLDSGASEDCNRNDVPDECESDTDGDNIIDGCDACPFTHNEQDSDSDGIGDCFDNCPDVFNPGQVDADLSGTGDACENVQIIQDCNGNDIDDEQDLATGSSEDCNDNRVPDECETDRDQDGLIDACDECPESDDDADKDGIQDCVDNCPARVNTNQKDTNGDGIGDACQDAQGKVGDVPGGEGDRLPEIEDDAPVIDDNDVTDELFCGAGAIGVLPTILLGLGATRVGRRRYINKEDLM